MAGLQKTLDWATLRRWNEIDAEIRIALFRLLAVLALYISHLVIYFGSMTQSSAVQAVSFHRTVTLVAMIAAMTSLLALACIRVRWYPRWFPDVIAAMDTMCVGWLVMTRPQADPVVMLFFLLIFAAALRLRLSQVWIGTIGAILLILLRWLAEKSGWTHFRVPGMSEPILAITAIALAGVLSGQIVRRVVSMVRSQEIGVKHE